MKLAFVLYVLTLGPSPLCQVLQIGGGN